MPDIPLSDADDLPAIVDHAIDQREPVRLTKDGHHVAAVIDAATLRYRLRTLSQAEAQPSEPFGDSDKAALGL